MDEHKNEIEIFDSTLKMSKKYKLNRAWVSKCAKNGKQYKGYYFEFFDPNITKQNIE